MHLSAMAPKHNVTSMAAVPSSSAGSRGGRGCDKGRGRGRGRGRGGRTSHLATSVDDSPPSSPERVDFKVEIISSSHRWVRLGNSFAKVMVASRPSGIYGFVQKAAPMGQFGWSLISLKTTPCI